MLKNWSIKRKIGVGLVGATIALIRLAGVVYHNWARFKRANHFTAAERPAAGALQPAGSLLTEAEKSCRDFLSQSPTGPTSS